MRLINIYTLELVDFISTTPGYIILSHRWTDDEPTYKEFVKGKNKNSAGYRKIVEFCNYVCNEGWTDAGRPGTTMFGSKIPLQNVEWVWVDTVCKSSYVLLSPTSQLVVDSCSMSV